MKISFALIKRWRIWTWIPLILVDISRASFSIKIELNSSVYVSKTRKERAVITIKNKNKTIQTFEKLENTNNFNTKKEE